MKKTKKNNVDKSHVFIGIGATAFLAACLAFQIDMNSVEKNEQFLKEKGYASIHIGGYNYWCAKGTVLRRNFTAVDPKGQEVEGEICAKRLFLSDSIETHPIENSSKKPKI